MVKFIGATIKSPSPEVNWLEVPWFEFIEVFSLAVQINLPTIPFPIVVGSVENKEKPAPWEYPGRSWFFWLNLFSSTYSWTEDVIANLDIDTALGLYQEIEINNQLNKEWEWGLSELAYPYNKSTKTSKYKPLARPEWMMPMIPKQLPVIKMRRDMLPVGNIIDLQQQEMDRNKKKSGI